jgi:hypothetical protein
MKRLFDSSTPQQLNDKRLLAAALGLAHQQARLNFLG